MLLMNPTFLDPQSGIPRSSENPCAARMFPAGSCDTHFHVFGNPWEFPFSEDRSYTPDPASMGDYRQAFGPLGVDKCVLVQPSVYGRDHSLLKQVLRNAAEGAMRGVAVIYEDTADSEIDTLHALGVRGARCNALFRGGVSSSSLRAIAERIRGLGWHIQLLVNVDDAPDLAPQVAAMGMNVVVDHFGHPRIHSGAQGRGLKNLQALMKEGLAWVKFSGVYRISETASANDPAILPIAKALAQANPDRILWGSDWPHPGIQAHSHSSAELAHALMEWVPAQMLKKILVDNPARLYWGR